jgi:hypothetical protein
MQSNIVILSLSSFDEYGVLGFNRSPTFKSSEVDAWGRLKKQKRTHGCMHELEENEHLDSNHCIRDHHEGMMEE